MSRDRGDSKLKVLKPAKNYRFVPVILSIVVCITLCGVLLSYDSPKNPFFMIKHYIYSPFDAPYCLSKIGKRIGVAPSYSAIDEYIRKNLHSDMDKAEVHKVFERISPVDINEYNNIDGAHFSDIVILMCDEPLNNPVYTIAYSSDGKFVSIEQEEFP